jgi:hypothetical protein
VSRLQDSPALRLLHHLVHRNRLRLHLDILERGHWVDNLRRLRRSQNRRLVRHCLGLGGRSLWRRRLEQLANGHWLLLLAVRRRTGVRYPRRVGHVAAALGPL